jgi:hypothetical protein
LLLESVTFDVQVVPTHSLFITRANLYLRQASAFVSRMVFPRLEKTVSHNHLHLARVDCTHDRTPRTTHEPGRDVGTAFVNVHGRCPCTFTVEERDRANKDGILLEPPKTESVDEGIHPMPAVGNTCFRCGHSTPGVSFATKTAWNARPACSGMTTTRPSLNPVRLPCHQPFQMMESSGGE